MESYNPIYFGFLGKNLQISTEDYEIKTLPDLKERCKHVGKYTNRDGFIYPPQISTFEVDNHTRQPTKEIENTSRPANVFHEIPSHTVTIKQREISQIKLLEESLLVHLLAFINGTRLQLSQWRFDGRIPVKSTLNISISESTQINFINHVYQWWKNQPETLKIKFVNVLYFYTRASSLENEWDAFIHQYMTFDAIFSIFSIIYPEKTNKVSGKGKISHEGRFDVMLTHFNIPFNETKIKSIYKARNELFHEATWTGEMIGFGPQNDASYYPYHLARLNSRLICAISTYTNNFSKSAWWAMGTFGFNPIV